MTLEKKRFIKCDFELYPFIKNYLITIIKNKRKIQKIPIKKMENMISDPQLQKIIDNPSNKLCFECGIFLF